MSDDDEVVHGTFVPPEIKAEFDSLRGVFDSKAAMDRLDTYGKWLFGSSTIIGALGAGLSNSAVSRLHGIGTWCFASAVLMFGACLVAASLSIAPKWVMVRLSDLQSLRAAVDIQFKTRQRLLTAAAVLFALALALAASSPFLSLFGSNEQALVHYSVDEKGTLDATLEGTSLKPGTFAGLSVNGRSGAGSQPTSIGTVDKEGQVKVTLKVSNLASSEGPVDLISCLRHPTEAQCFATQKFAIK